MGKVGVKVSGRGWWDKREGERDVFPFQLKICLKIHPESLPKLRNFLTFYH